MKNGTILLVEDDENEQMLMLRALKKHNIGQKVIVARDGAEALDYLFCTNNYANRDPKDLPQLVLLDLNLPKLNGLEVLHHIRSDPRTNRLAVVLLSSSAEERELRQAYMTGANSYMRKPVDYQQFEELVGQLGSYWLFLNEIPSR
jgi:two-component system, response regulator